MAGATRRTERRRHPRVAIARQVSAKFDRKVHNGEVKDISASGAALAMQAEIEEDGFVELSIEDVSPVSGFVARSFEDGFAVEFDIDEEDQERLVSEIREIQHTMQVDDE